MMYQFSSAIRYLSKTIDEVLPGDPLYVESLITRSQCYSQINEKIKALQDINESLIYQPDNLRARLERGRFLVEDNPEDAIEEYEKVLDAEDIDTDLQAEAYFRIGYAFIKKGEPDVAIRSLLQAQRLDPNHPRVSLIKDIINEIDEKIPKTPKEDLTGNELKDEEGEEGGEVEDFGEFEEVFMESEFLSIHTSFSIDCF